MQRLHIDAQLHRRHRFTRGAASPAAASPAAASPGGSLPRREHRRIRRQLLHGAGHVLLDGSTRMHQLSAM